MSEPLNVILYSNWSNLLWLLPCELMNNISKDEQSKYTMPLVKGKAKHTNKLVLDIKKTILCGKKLALRF